MFADRIESIRKYLAEHPALETLLWFAGAATCIGIVVWFLLISGYAAPPEFIYDQF